MAQLLSDSPRAKTAWLLAKVAWLLANRQLFADETWKGMVAVSIGCDSLGQPIGTRGFTISISLLIWGSFLESSKSQGS